MTKESFRRAPAHEGDGSDLDDVLLQIAIHLLRIEHVVERVVQRAQVGIDLVLQRPRQKSQALAGFDRRTRQDDAVHALRQQRRDRHGDGEVSLAGARRADAEDHVVFLDGFQIAALVQALGLDGAAPERALPSGFGQSAQRGLGIGHQHAQHAVQVAVVEDVAGAVQVIVVGEDLLGAGSRRGRRLPVQWHSSAGRW